MEDSVDGGGVVNLSPNVQNQVDKSLSALMRLASEANDSGMLRELTQITSATGATLNVHQEVCSRRAQVAKKGSGMSVRGCEGACERGCGCGSG